MSESRWLALKCTRTTSLSHSLPLQVLNLAADVLKHVPELIDYDAAAKLVADDMTPLNVVLLQEVPTHSNFSSRLI